MRKSICHYSFHRTWKEKSWDCDQLVNAVKDLGVEAVDFHARLLGSPEGAADRILSSLKKSGLILSGLSLGNNFNEDDEAKFRDQVDTVKTWIQVAAQVKAPVSRIFGGGLSKDQRHDANLRKQKMTRIMQGMQEVVEEAEKSGIVLALENHGGLPCTGEEQVEVIEQINSKHLRATIDVGNYLQGGQEGHDGTKVAAKYAAYVHFKDFKKIPDAGLPLGYQLEACTVGDGDVDHQKCLEYLAAAGYNGFVALEFEGIEGEAKSIPASVAFMSQVMEPFASNEPAQVH